MDDQRAIQTGPHVPLRDATIHARTDVRVRTQHQLRWCVVYDNTATEPRVNT